LCLAVKISFQAFTLSNGVRLPAEFKVGEKEIELIVERYRYVKKA
jgi:virulence-associated protein VagC